MPYFHECSNCLTRTQVQVVDGLETDLDQPCAECGSDCCQACLVDGLCGSCSRDAQEERDADADEANE